MKRVLQKRPLYKNDPYKVNNNLEFVHILKIVLI